MSDSVVSVVTVVVLVIVVGVYLIPEVIDLQRLKWFFEDVAKRRKDYLEKIDSVPMEFEDEEQDQ